MMGVSRMWDLNEVEAVFVEIDRDVYELERVTAQSLRLLDERAVDDICRWMTTWRVLRDLEATAPLFALEKSPSGL